jgi:hypothetical protein
MKVGDRTLKRNGMQIEEAMATFRDWVIPASLPLFVGFNATSTACA